ncbi:MAG TPA: nicotinate-nucleotide adenylyltransferase [Vicinamibacteria bacterium]|jgi:nicotinate-nucleotide adenylyltransferase
MNVGILGGTFDPIHLGHLRAAEVARQALGLDEVLFVPAGSPPHRSGPLGAALDRFAMVALATAAHPAFHPSDVELRDGASYTVDTLAALDAARPGDALFLIVGSDTYAEMTTWREHERVFSLCQVAVVARPGAEATPAAAGQGRRVHVVPGDGLPVSATDVRRRLREGRSVRYLVPEAVDDYIRKRRLYR